MKLATKQIVHRTKPANLRREDDFLFQVEYEKSFDDVFTKDLKDLYILPNGMILKKSFCGSCFIIKN